MPFGGHPSADDSHQLGSQCLLLVTPRRCMQTRVYRMHAGEREHFAHVCTPSLKQGWEMAMEHRLMKVSLFPTITGYSQLLGSLSPGMMLPMTLSGYVTPQAGALSFLR